MYRDIRIWGCWRTVSQYSVLYCNRRLGVGLGVAAGWGARTGAQGMRQAGAGALGERRGVGERQAYAGARWAAGWAACARLVCSAGPSWVFWCM